MTASPEPGPIDYPDSWKPGWLKKQERERADKRAEFERSVAALPDSEIERIRGGNR